MSGNTPIQGANSSKLFGFPPLRIGRWITKHLIENRLAELVETVDGALAQVAEFIGLVEDRGNALLLVEWWKRDFRGKDRCYRRQQDSFAQSPFELYLERSQDFEPSER